MTPPLAMPATKIQRTARFIPVSVLREDPNPVGILDSPEQTLQYWRQVIAAQPDYEPDKEQLVAILLNTRLRPFAWHRVSTGSLNETIGHPRDILRPVIVGAAWGFLLAHNHPSGEPTPSRADRDLTARLSAAADLLQIRLVDHIITTDPDRESNAPYFSFQEAGILK